MPNFNYHGLFRELAYIAASVVLSAIGVGSIIFVYNHTGLYGAVFFSIIVFLATRLLLLGAGNERNPTNPRNPEFFRENNFRENNCNCERRDSKDLKVVENRDRRISNEDRNNANTQQGSNSQNQQRNHNQPRNNQNPQRPFGNNNPNQGNPEALSQ